MNLSEIYNNLTLDMEKELRVLLPNHSFSEVYTYSLLPAGKFFRPILSLCMFEDLKLNTSSVEKMHFAKSLEYHHTYTLIHDDLPSMDNDDFRRGRPSTHKKFGQWQAILAGDGLLNLSYQSLALSNCPNPSKLLKFYSWALGSKGLIQGQVLDLSEEMNLDFSKVIETHKLKTSRLLQASIVGPLFFAKKINMRQFIDLYKLGHHLGLVFQLLDDLNELTDVEVGEHELAINPYLKYQDQCMEQTKTSLSKVEEYIKKYELTETRNFLANYIKKNSESITQKKEVLLKNLSLNIKNNNSIDLMPIMDILSRF